jgi:hypothetical protein
MILRHEPKKSIFHTLGTYLLLGAVLAFVQKSHGQTPSRGEEIIQSCDAEVAQYLGKENPNFTKKYFQLRAKLSLHRLSWLHLKKLEKDGVKNPERQKVESSILELLKEHDESVKNDPEFKKSAEAFAARPLSRKTLSNVLGPLTEAMRSAGAASMTEADAPFWLGVEDLKMIQVLSELEDIKDVKSSRLTNSRTAATGMLNLIKIINSSYNSGNVADVSNQISRVQRAIDQIQKELAELEKTLFEKIAGKSDACKALSLIEGSTTICTNCDKSPPEYELKIGLKSILEKALNEQLKQNNYDGIRYNDVWLHTEKNSRSKPKKQGGSSPAKPTKKPELTPPPISAEEASGNGKPVDVVPIAAETKEESTVGLPAQAITQPEDVIAEFSQADETKVVAESPEKKQAWSQALLRKEKFFISGKELYSTETGLKVSPTPPEKELKRALFSKNGKKVYSQSGSLYETSSGQPIELEDLEKKRKITVEADKNDKAYRLAHAVALENGDPTFQVGQQYFETPSQKKLSSPYPSAKALSQAEWVARVNKLSDEERVLEHQARYWDQKNPETAKCSNVILLNKKDATVKIYDRKTGKLLSSEPAVFGKKVGDEPTKFSTNREASKKTGSVERAFDAATTVENTGAGEYLMLDVPYSDKTYTISPEFKQYLKESYNGNLLRLCRLNPTTPSSAGSSRTCDADTIALHEYIHSEKTKRAAAAKKPYDGKNRRLSNGCVNVSPEFFSENRPLLKSSCSFFVLPEENGNRFQVTDEGALELQLKP